MSITPEPREPREVVEDPENPAAVIDRVPGEVSPPSTETTENPAQYTEVGESALLFELVSWDCEGRGSTGVSAEEGVSASAPRFRQA